MWLLSSLPLQLVLLVLVVVLTVMTNAQVAKEPPRYYHLPMHEVMQYPVYLHASSLQEIAVSYAEKGSELRTGDYITHADGIRILNGGLSGFLKSGEKEIIVPVIEDADEKFGGQKLIGFVLIQPVSPRKVSTRRGEIFFDMDEGGPAPTMKLGNLVIGNDGAKTTSDPNYQPPPHGGGPCITGKDCYYFNGTCTMGQCACIGVHTGSFCQLDRPDFAAMSVRLKASQQYQEQKKHQQQLKEMGMSPSVKKEAPPPLTAPPPNSPKTGPPPEEVRAAQELARAKEINDAQQQQEQQQHQQQHDGADEGSHEGQGEGKKKKKRKKKPAAAQNSDGEGIKQDEQASQKDDKIHEWAAGDQNKAESQQEGRQQVPAQNQVTVEDMYGEGKPYPEPYTAGRLPSQTMNERHRRRTNREPFIYSVRFRSAPLGLVFDNKLPNSTIVEQVVKGQQAQLSDIKEGDRLLAIDQFNVTDAPAKVSMRIMSTLPWPRILLFETRYAGEDPNVVQQKVKSRSYNISIFYPPTLVGEYTLRLGEWSPQISLTQPTSEAMTKKLNGKTDFCPVYRIKSLDDPFGCRPPENVYALTKAHNDMVEQNGFVNMDTERESPMLTALLQEAFTRKLSVEPRSLAMMKRGECTFVAKAKSLRSGGANLGVVVNTDNEIIDMPAGKENTVDCTVPFGMMKNEDAHFLHIAARMNEIWAVVYDTMTPTCEKTLMLAEDLIDKWPHSVPPLSVQKIVQNKPPDQSKVRGMTEEGGRVALSGETGWAFFDYHLAMFGPQEVPIGPLKLVMAMPPFGCDVAAYTVRIADSVVAILRGGGCSFGIKVINAQKLGAKAVMIVNTDDMKTMRLMALPDEVPLIKIPCIMVSRRIQYYLEEQIRPYYPVDQHLVSIQPTGIFGDYEAKNPLELPKRLNS